jgi:hypothetical protein
VIKKRRSTTRIAAAVVASLALTVVVAVDAATGLGATTGGQTLQIWLGVT